MILTRRTLVTHMDRMKKAAQTGLLSLAVTELLFCVCALPHSFQQFDQFEYNSITFWLFYSVYGSAFINIFITASTWLTVMMAVSRYLAICYPITGRQLLGGTFSKLSVVLVIIFSIVFNMPRFAMLQIDYVACEGGWYSYFAMNGPLTSLAESIYMWLYFIICILIPICVLSFCNFFMMKALRMSARMRREHTHGGRQRSFRSKNLVTLTLIFIVIFYFISGISSRAVKFWKISSDYKRLNVTFL